MLFTCIQVPYFFDRCIILDSQYKGTSAQLQTRPKWRLRLPYSFCNSKLRLNNKTSNKWISVPQSNKTYPI